MEHGFLTRALNTYHYPYRTHFPICWAQCGDSCEMAIYSAPGVVEFLPQCRQFLEKAGLREYGVYFCQGRWMEWDLEKGVIKSGNLFLKGTGAEPAISLRGLNKCQQIMKLDVNGNSGVLHIKAGKNRSNRVLL
jgi:hypothetical protein